MKDKILLFFWVWGFIIMRLAALLMCAALFWGFVDELQFIFSK